MKFVKMHGIGNDYVYVDVVSDPALEERFEGEAGRGLVRRMSDRHRGVGGDGVILVARPHDGVRADVRMRMFNSDGSESEMCGNGVRCVAKFAHDRLGVRANPMRVETGRGVLSIGYRTEGRGLVEATVDMGEPILELERVPVEAGRLARAEHPREFVIETPGGSFAASFVSMGNPHAVVFVEDAAAVELWRVGPLIERHPAFPRRINAHFVQVAGRSEATVRTWERGAGMTQACGTGACAVLVAGVMTGRLDRHATMHLPGGDLEIAWDEGTGHVLMTGPAEEVFEGEWKDGGA